ncbi:helix-turn-helix transcriptional regulator [Raineyella sp. W15-4]|uniref:helix-turn-helix domain-containing protein n=1 Tax=Raineyella sp. W15-4 TaxID=3081651 RepID=UPI002952C053|nr:helix-turn-helix transcriptional regulator [Raineyella sp. W15-4]WOQ17910.1 helix-turn-helix transcriptional regulator [Raineyella sp. W15-4]
MPVVPEPNLQALGLDVARRRLEKGWTIEYLAEHAGLSRRSVINVENGHHVPDLKTVHALAHALDVSLGELLTPLCAHHLEPDGPAKQ